MRYNGALLVIALGALTVGSVVGAGSLQAEPPAALASPAAGDPDLCDTVRVPAVGPACLVAAGHYVVPLSDGHTLVTHGPDPLPPPGDVGFQAGSDERRPMCASSPVMHVLYGRPVGAPDRSETVVEEIQQIVRRMNAVLAADGVASGGITADFRVVCDEQGEIQVDAFTSGDTGGAYTTDFNIVVEGARQAGFTATGTNYLIFFDGTSPGVCGVGSISYDESASASNNNLEGPDYGVVYEGCWNGRTPMHENGHNMGAVQRMATMSDLAGHCLEGDDVMCYPYPTQLVIRCGADRLYFDCGYDTYFHTDPPAGSWLASNWNLGSPLNTYVAFGRGHEVHADEVPKPDEPAQDEGAEGDPTEGPSNGTDDDAQGSNETVAAHEPRRNLPPLLKVHLAVAGASVQGDASATHDPEDDPFIVRWSWGDGHVDEGVDATHRYGPGVYLLHVEAEDAAGGVATVEHTLEIAAPREPPAVSGEANAAPAGAMASVALVLVAFAYRCRR